MIMYSGELLCNTSTKKKSQVCGELTPMLGQLSNVYQIKDPTTSKCARLQVILAIGDATSLPWQATRTARTTSMHELEEGRLTWGDVTQWALNRLSDSQIIMAYAT